MDFLQKVGDNDIKSKLLKMQDVIQHIRPLKLLSKLSVIQYVDW